MAYDQQGNEFSRRLLVTLFIAGMAFFLYMTNTQENPVTGVKQHVSLTPDEEVRLGIQAAPEMASQMGGEISQNDPRYIETQKIGREIVEQTEAHKGPWNFKFHVLGDTKTVNAFALPGGQIFITLGLLNLLQTEAQLAGVLSHEIGHVIQRHSAQQMAKGQLGQMLVVAATQMGSSNDQATAAAVIANVVNQMMQLRYGRHDELEADQWGLKLMSEVGYNPEAMVEVMEILKKASGSGRGIEMLQTHPHPEARQKQIREYLLKNPATKKFTEGKRLQDIWEQ